MGIADPERAFDIVRRFHELAIENQKTYRVYIRSRETFMARDDPAHAGLLGLLPLIEDIARELDPQVGLALFQAAPAGRGWAWRTALEGIQRLVGILERTEDREAIFTPAGPSLIADSLHRWVWDAAKNLWADCHYGSAVQKAGAAVETHTQHKLGRQDLSGADLYTQAFTIDANPGTPRLRFLGIEETTTGGDRAQDWISAHEGAMHFGRGCAQRIRNPANHSADELAEQEALEHLAALSILARWVETAEVRTGQPRVATAGNSGDGRPRPT